MNLTAALSPDQKPTMTADAASDRESQVTFVDEIARSLFLWQRSLRRLFLSRQTLIAFLLLAVCCLIVLAWARQRNPSPKRFAEMMLIPTYIAFLLPIFAICYGASSVGGEREDGTLIYLLIASMPRPLVFTMKFLASLTLSTVMGGVSLGALCLLAGTPGREVWFVFWPGSLLGVMAYTALFVLLGTIFRHGTVLALVYWFFLEVMLGNLPGAINRVSLAFYVRSLIYESGKALKLAPLGNPATNQFHAITGSSAALILFGLIVGFYLLGVITFSRKEYHDVG